MTAVPNASGSTTPGGQALTAARPAKTKITRQAVKDAIRSSQGSD
jgi:hypothetical protein